MSLSSELLSQFVKITNDKPKTKSESTVYGTTVIHNGRTYVKLDGSDSDVLTPVSTTASTQDGERVTVSIKNHTATITGNISSPSVRTGDLEETKTTITLLDHVVATKASLDDLEVERARIDAIVAGDVTVNGTLEANVADIVALKADNALIQEKLTATEAEVDDLQANKLDASVATATYATIEKLEATDADVYNLEVAYGNFETATANKFTAVNASIADLEADKLDANTASITYAKITELNALVADVNTLEANVADIDTLIFGSASGSTIQTSFANAVIAQLGNAQIKSAMIENVSADKITAGDIITNNVRVKSQNGLLLISDETIQISDNSRVRVQIGKDAASDYSINIWDEAGNLMFSEGGITDSAIKEAIIRNDMVSDTANIAAHKLDIDSLFEEINGSTNTIKSTQIYLDDQAQTLDVAFKTMETEVTSMGTNIATQGTQISVLQGQIDSKIWQQDIDTATDEMTTRYSQLEQSLTGFQANVGETYATKTELADIEVGGRNLILDSATPITLTSPADYNYQYWTFIPTVLPLTNEHPYSISADVEILEGDVTEISVKLYDDDLTTQYAEVTSTIRNGHIEGVFQSVDGNATKLLLYAGVAGKTGGNSITFSNIKFEKGSIPTDWTPAPEDAENNISSLNTQVSSIEQTVDGLSTTVREECVTKEEFSNLEIGGRNLFENSGKLIAKYMGNYSCPETAYSSGEDPSVPSGQYIALTFTLDPDTTYVGGPYLASYLTGYVPKMIVGEEYTVSVWAKCSTAKSLGKCSVEFLKDVTSKEIPTLATEWQRYVVTGIYNGNSTSSTAITFYYGAEWVDGDVFYISSPKIEKGNRVTDWTPAPEDIETRISSNESSITQLSDKINVNVTAIDDLKTSVSNVEQTANSLSSKVSVAQKTADDIQVGGRNLVINTGLTRDRTNLSWYQSTGTEYLDEIMDDEYTRSGKTRVITYVEAGCYGPYWTTTNTSLVNKNFTVGDIYTQSVLMKATNEITVIWGHEGLPRHQATLNNEWQRFVYTVSATDTGTMQRGISFYPYPFATGVPAGTVFYIADYKLERGNRATDWTPAPEDMATVKDNELAQNTADAAQETAKNAETLIQQLSDSISMLVTDGNGTSLMTQTDSGWTFSTAEIQSLISSAAENLDALNNELGNTNHTVEVLQQAVADLGEIAEYVKIGAYEDEPCIELGEGDSEFKLRITNTRILFMEGSSVIAHFTNQSLHIKKAVIEEELQQGEFVWKARSNGNLGLIWKGVNS